MTSKPQFREDYNNHAQADPLDEHGAVDFNWQAIYRALGEPEHENSETDLIAKTAEALRVLLAWLLDGEINKYYEKKVGRRAIAMAWVLDPSMFEGSPSLTKLAERLGYTKFSLSIFTSDFSKTFNFFNRAQAHGNGKRRKESFNPPTLAAGSAAAPGSYGSTQKTLTPPQESRFGAESQLVRPILPLSSLSSPEIQTPVKTRL